MAKLSQNADLLHCALFEAFPLLCTKVVRSLLAQAHVSCVHSLSIVSQKIPVAAVQLSVSLTCCYYGCRSAELARCSYPAQVEIIRLAGCFLDSRCVGIYVPSTLNSRRVGNFNWVVVKIMVPFWVP